MNRYLAALGVGHTTHTVDADVLGRALADMAVTA